MTPRLLTVLLGSKVMPFSVITSLDIEPLRHSVSKRVALTRTFSFHLWKCPCERHWTPLSPTLLWGVCYRRKSNAWVIEKRCIQRHSAWKCELMWRWLWLKALGVVNKNWRLRVPEYHCNRKCCIEEWKTHTCKFKVTHFLFFYFFKYTYCV